MVYLIRDTFSIYDLCIGNEKNKSKPFNGKSQKVEMLLEIHKLPLQSSVVCVTSEHLANLITSQ